MAVGDISFDSNDLQTDNIISSDIRHENPTKESDIYAIAHGNSSAIPHTNYPNRTIVDSGKLIAASVEALDDLIDTFKGYFRDADRNLDIGYSGGTRRYIATAQRIEIDRPGGLAFANFEVEWKCTSPFGRETATTSALSASGRTAATYTDSHTFLGTAPWQLPVITVTISALTGGTDKTITIGNGTNNLKISVQRTWSAADVLVIDSVLKKVTVNGTEVDFTGSFPEFEPGSMDIDYDDDLTTRTFDIDVDYYPMWL